MAGAGQPDERFAIALPGRGSGMIAEGCYRDGSARARLQSHAGDEYHWCASARSSDGDMPRTLLQTAGVRIGGLSKELSVPTGRIGRVSTQAAERCAAEESDTSAVINLAWVCTRLWSLTEMLQGASISLLLDIHRRTSPFSNSQQRPLASVAIGKTARFGPLAHSFQFEVSMVLPVA